MLYPREDKEKHQLQFLCRQCDYSRYPKKTDTAQHIVDRTNFNYKSKEDIVISSDLSKDPTLGRVFDWRCPRCRGLGGVFYQLPERVAEDAMTLVYVCTQPGCGAWEIQQPDAQGGDDSREKDEDGEHPAPHPSAQSARQSFRFPAEKEEEDRDASSDADSPAGGPLSVKRPLDESQDEDHETDQAGDVFNQEQADVDDDDLFGEREEDIFGSSDHGGPGFDEEEYTHRPEPHGDGELDDVTFE